ncbi:MAG: prolyl oligopeptidase family serine peptidase [Rhodospirillales bacterium]|nr:prolyl oligopeptidase family serine peptidase [Rhodospirillales bacterium]
MRFPQAIILLSFSAVLLTLQTAGQAQAEIKWIDLALKGGGSVKASLGIIGSEKRPAIIFNHGTGVRHFGNAVQTRQGNMDVTDYVKALNKAGYHAIAPLRQRHRNAAYVEHGGTVGSGREWDEVVEEGIDVSASALAYLSKRTEVDTARIAIMGYSEGGNVTLWSSLRQSGYRAVVLLAPAALSSSPTYNLRSAASQDNLAPLSAPVFLAVGSDDIRPIRRITSRRLVPNLKQLGTTIEAHTNYPGGHAWFYEPQEELMKDVLPFLAKYLK